MKVLSKPLLWLGLGFVCYMVWIAPLVLAAGMQDPLSTVANQPQVKAVAAASPLKKLQFSAGEWPPYLGAKLPGQGMAAQLIRDIFAEAGYQVSFHFLPWPRAYRETLHGKYAATAIWMYTPERAIDFYYSAAVLEEEFVLFQLKAQPVQFDKLEDLTGLELGGGFGYSYGAAFDAAIAAGMFKMTRVSQTIQNFQRLLKGRIQAFPEEKQVGYHILRSQLPQSQHLFSHADTVILRNQSFVLFPKQSPDSQLLLEIFQQGLLQLQSSGRYQRYFDTAAGSPAPASKPAADHR
jgi:polar amino acid transport system substrate-binding protein